MTFPNAGPGERRLAGRGTAASLRAYSDHPTPRKIELLAEMDTTWDGLPIARERPYACAVVVWRQGAERMEFLLLHRLAPGGADYEGEWAWTPPSGARQPREAPDAAAARELEEEIGLTLPLTPLLDASASEDVALYVAQAPQDAEVVLDDEHDHFVWLPLEEALPKCLPPVVALGLANAAGWIKARSTAT